MKLKTIYVIADRDTGDLWPDWFYRRSEARRYQRERRAEHGSRFRGVVRKYMPEQQPSDPQEKKR